MTVPINTSRSSTPTSRWNYVEVQVLDGPRSLTPTHIAFDRLIFAEPPRLTSQEVEIIVTNNGQSHSSRALVLPHDAESTRIPIQLIQLEQHPAAKLTA